MIMVCLPEAESLALAADRDLRSWAAAGPQPGRLAAAVRARLTQGSGCTPAIGPGPSDLTQAQLCRSQAQACMHVSN
eukprot:2198676-Rhodomonas_salina.1